MLILDLLWNYSGCGVGVGVGKTVIILLTQSSRAGAWTELGNCGGTLGKFQFNTVNTEPYVEQ